MNDLGIVIIGRNEGERLHRCLNSVAGRGWSIVYVDSGSTDGSLEIARSVGAEIVELDLSRPFTAARARNEGFAALIRILPSARYVQFVDGDCQIVEGWIDRAVDFLETNPKFAVTCGRRRELYPDQTIYNQLADIECNSPVGETTACGGDSLMRTDAFQAVGGFNPTLIAGEEPELCVRLRRAGWKIFRLDAEMTLHDMAMTRFKQWWRRTIRAGHAYAEGSAMHGQSPEKHWVRETRSIIVWGLVLPLVFLALAWPTRGFSLLLFLIYPLQTIRIAARFHRNGMNWRTALLYSSACMIGKFASAVGVSRYWFGRVRRKPQPIIDYK